MVISLLMINVLPCSPNPNRAAETDRKQEGKRGVVHFLFDAVFSFRRSERGLCNLDATVLPPPPLTPSAVTPASQTPRAHSEREGERGREREIEEVWCVAEHPQTPDCAVTHTSLPPRGVSERTELIPSVKTVG